MDLSFDNLTYDLFKYIIQFDVKLGLRLCQTNKQYYNLLTNDEKIWHNYFSDNWFPLQSTDNGKEKCVKFLRHPISAEIKLVDWIQDYDNIVVAGGSVVNTIMGDEHAIKGGDVDIFFINDQLTKEDIVNKIKQLHSWLSEKYPTVHIDVKGKSVVLFGEPDQPNEDGYYDFLSVQVIFMKLFKSVHEVLRSFDLPNCSFGYRGGDKIYYTESALNYFCNKIIYYYNPTNNPNRAERMRKYSYRPYNKVVRVNQCLHDCCPTDLIDYTRYNYSVREENITLERMSELVIL